MAKRSPILGFNHNFRHRGLVFHVQTEDSGVNNPHIFTHLFNGGVILSTRKLTYDIGAAEEVVKALMQAQHKAMLKELKRGVFDEKINQYFGDDPDLDINADGFGEPTDPSGGIPVGYEIVDSIEELELELGDIEVVVAAASENVPEDEAPIFHSDHILAGHGSRNPFDDLQLEGNPMDTLRGPAPPGPIGETPSGAVVIHAAAPESAPLPPGAKPTRPGQYAQHTGKDRRLTPHGTPIPDDLLPLPPIVADAEPAGKAASREAIHRSRTSTRPLQSEPDSGVHQSPSVIVGAPTQVIGGDTPSRPVPRRAREQVPGSLFGKDLISEKSLDEVILAYLSEDGSERK